MAKTKSRQDLSIFAQRLFQRRTDLGLSQETLGMRIGMADPESAKVKISRYESDNNAKSIATLKSLAEELNVSLDWLVGLTNNEAGLKDESDLAPDDFGALQEFRAGHIELLVERWKKRLRKSPGH